MFSPPTRPVVAVGAVVLDDDGRVVLIRRRKAPLAGRWTLPGGSVELAEPLGSATAREVREETGLVVTVGPLVEVYEHVSRGADQAVTYHYVILDYLCRPTGGVLCAGDDAADARWVTPEAYDEYDLNPATRRVIAKALNVAAEQDSRTARLSPPTTGS